MVRKVAWEDIQILIDKGWSGGMIAEELGLNVKSLYKRLWRHGVNLKSGRRKLKESEMKKDVRIENGVGRIGLLDARKFLEKHHYLKNIKPSTTYGLFENGELVGVAAVSSCSGPTVAATVFGKEYGSHVRELHRFCLKDGLPKNTASKFLAETLKLYALENSHVWAVVTFADKAQGHEGVIYKAVGAVEMQTSGNRQLMVTFPDGKVVTGRQETIIAEIVRSGFREEDCKIGVSEGKKKFVIFIGTKDVKRKSRELFYKYQ